METNTLWEKQPGHYDEGYQGKKKKCVGYGTRQIYFPQTVSPLEIDPIQIPFL